MTSKVEGGVESGDCALAQHIGEPCSDCEGEDGGDEGCAEPVIERELGKVGIESTEKTSEEGRRASKGERCSHQEKRRELDGEARPGELHLLGPGLTKEDADKDAEGDEHIEYRRKKEDDRTGEARLEAKLKEKLFAQKSGGQREPRKRGERDGCDEGEERSALHDAPELTDISGMRGMIDDASDHEERGFIE